VRCVWCIVHDGPLHFQVYNDSDICFSAPTLQNMPHPILGLLSTPRLAVAFITIAG